MKQPHEPITPEKLIVQLGRIEDLPQLTVELIELVRTIPYYCGTPNCNNFGCVAIRDAREKCVDIINRPVKE